MPEPPVLRVTARKTDQTQPLQHARLHLLCVGGPVKAAPAVPEQHNQMSSWLPRKRKGTVCRKRNPCSRDLACLGIAHKHPGTNNLLSQAGIKVGLRWFPGKGAHHEEMLGLIYCVRTLLARKVTPIANELLRSLISGLHINEPHVNIRNHVVLMPQCHQDFYGTVNRMHAARQHRDQANEMVPINSVIIFDRYHSGHESYET